MEFTGVHVVFSAIIAFFLTFFVIRLLDRLKRRDAETEALAIVERANVDAGRSGRASRKTMPGR